MCHYVSFNKWVSFNTIRTIQIPFSSKHSSQLTGKVHLHINQPLCHQLVWCLLSGTINYSVPSYHQILPFSPHSHCYWFVYSNIYGLTQICAARRYMNNLNPRDCLLFTMFPRMWTWYTLMMRSGVTSGVFVFCHGIRTRSIHLFIMSSSIHAFCWHV